MRVKLYAPKWDRSCDSCVQWWYQSDGSIRHDVKGNPIPRGNDKTPCRSCPKVPESARVSIVDPKELRKLAVDLSPENRAAISAYHRYVAVGFPDDSLVSWYAGILRDEEEEFRRWSSRQMIELLSRSCSREQG